MNSEPTPEQRAVFAANRDRWVAELRWTATLVEVGERAAAARFAEAVADDMDELLDELEADS